MTISTAHWRFTADDHHRLVDLVADEIEVCRKSGTKGFRDVRRLMAGEKLSPLAFPDIGPVVEEVRG